MAKRARAAALPAILVLTLAIGSPAAAQVVQPEDVLSDADLPQVDEAELEASTDVTAEALAEIDADGESLPEALEPAEEQEGLPAPEAPVLAQEATEGEGTLVALSRAYPIDSRELAVVGVSWDWAPDGVEIDMRSATAGEWTAWESIEVDALDGSDGVVDPDVRGGSDPFVVVGADEVQVRMVVPEGAPAVQDATVSVYAADTLATDALAAEAAQVEAAQVETASFGLAPLPEATTLQVSTALAEPAPRESVLHDALTAQLDTSPDGAAEVVTAATTASVPGYPAGTYLSASRPSISPRSSWGAVAPKSGIGTAKVTGAVVHHTAGSNTYTASQVPALLRGIQRFHMQDRGWSDIGYNFLVDKYGGIWEGRHGSLAGFPAGVHTAGYNSNSVGISVMGNYVNVDPSSTVVTAVSRTLAWKLAEANVLADGRWGSSTLSAIIGHKDVSATACPGRIQNRLGTIRSTARGLQKINTPSIPRSFLHRDLNGDGLGSVIRWNSQGVTASTASPLPVASGSSVGTNWTIIDAAGTQPARNAGDVGEVIARMRADGRLYAYRGTGTGSFVKGRTLIGPGWGVMSHIVAPGDWNRNGVNDIIGIRRSDGAMLLYPGLGNHRYGKPVQIGRGWGSMRSVTGAGDMTGNGHPDIVALTTSGELRLYANDGRGGFRPVTVLARVASGSDAVVGAGDLNGDGRRDLVVRGRDGRMTTYFGRSGGRVQVGPTWGSQWNRVSPIMAADNWNGRGSGGLLAASDITGKMYRYDGLTAGALATSSSLPISTQGVDQLFVVGDLRNDRTADVITRRTDGALMLHESTSTGTWRAPRQIGRGWGIFDLVTAAGDVDGDGVPDVLARHATTGALHVYPLNRDGTFKSPFVIGTGFSGMRVIGVGGWATGSSADVISVRSNGRAYLHRGRGTAGLAAPVEIGTGMAGLQLLGAGDFRRTGNNDLLTMDTSGRLWLFGGTGTGTMNKRIAVGGIKPGGSGNLS